MRKIVSNYVLPSIIGIASGLFSAHCIGKIINPEKQTLVENLYNKTTEMYDDVAERIETEKAIKAEGIKAKSYAEAKMQLDSIRTDRLFKAYNITPPNQNDDVFSKTSKYMELNNRQLEDILKKLDSMTPENINQEQINIAK